MHASKWRWRLFALLIGFFSQNQCDDGVLTRCPRPIVQPATEQTEHTTVTSAATDPATNSESTKAISIPSTARTTSITPVRTTATTTISERPSSQTQTQSSTLRSEIPTSIDGETFPHRTTSVYSTKLSTHGSTTKIYEPAQLGDGGGSSNSMVIVGLAAGVALLVIVSVILVLVVLYRRRPPKKREIQEPVYNECLALTPDRVQAPAQCVDWGENIKEPSELVYADLTISPVDDTAEVVRPEPYVPTAYADIRSLRGPAPAADQEEGAAENQEAEDPMYAELV